MCTHCVDNSYILFHFIQYTGISYTMNTLFHFHKYIAENPDCTAKILTDNGLISGTTYMHKWKKVLVKMRNNGMKVKYSDRNWKIKTWVKHYSGQTYTAWMNFEKNLRTPENINLGRDIPLATIWNDQFINGPQPLMPSPTDASSQATEPAQLPVSYMQQQQPQQPQQQQQPKQPQQQQQQQQQQVPPNQPPNQPNIFDAPPQQRYQYNPKQFQ